MSSRGMSASSMITATATFGSSTGANEVNQAKGFRSGRTARYRSCRRRRRRRSARPPGALCRPRSASSPAAPWRSPGRSPGSATRAWSWTAASGPGPCTMLTRYGFITSPSLAIPAVTIAICSGVAATSNWPIGAQRDLRLVHARRGTGWPPRSARRRWRASKPNFCACSRSLSCADLEPEVGERGVAGDPQRVGSGGRRCRRSWWSSAGTFGVGQLQPVRRRHLVSGVLPSSSAAAAVTSLNVEPGG